MPVNWDSKESQFFANPTLDPHFFPSRWEGYADFKAHVWIATSGTTKEAKGAIKWVALSKMAFLASAYAVNAHLKSTAADVWLNALPLFHVGGLSIYARAYLSGAAVIQANFTKWSADQFMKALSSVTLTSLVPAQLYDLIKEGYEAPYHLRGVIIGGGHLTEENYQRAVALKWPVMPSFGMTECCSQIATAHLGEFRPSILSHMVCKTTEENILQIESPALFTGYLHVSSDQFHFVDPKKEGVFTTEDLVEIKDGKLYFFGRQTDWIKIGGENVSLFQLGAFFNQIKPSHVDAVLHPIDDERLGKVIQLVTLKNHEEEIETLVNAFNAGVMPYEKIRKVCIVSKIPRSELGKVLPNILDYCIIV